MWQCGLTSFLCWDYIRAALGQSLISLAVRMRIQLPAALRQAGEKFISSQINFQTPLASGIVGVCVREGIEVGLSQKSEPLALA